MQYPSDLCNRVMFAEGETVSPVRAARERGVTPTRAWVRSDGWTLGAPRRFYKAAQNLWRDEWVREIDLTNPKEVDAEFERRGEN